MAVPIFILLQTLAMLVTVSGQDLSEALPCSLEWVRMSIGSPLSKDAVAAHSGKYYISRLQHEEFEDSLLGWYDLTNGTATFFYLAFNASEPTILQDVATFEILTNPNFCTISWVSDPSTYIKYGVRSNGTTGQLVARVPADEEFFYPGLLDETTGTVDVLVVDLIESFSNFHIITSLSEGLRLLVREFEFEVDSLSSQPMSVGIDHIINHGNANVTQRVTHSKRVVETFEFPIKNEKTRLSKYTSGVTKQSGIPSFWGSSTSVTVDQQMSSGIEVTKTVIKETEIRIEKVVHVPKNTEVTVCSIVDIKDDVVFPYKSRGTYIAGGMSTQALYELLKEEGLDVYISDEGTVDTDVYGDFKGSIVFSTSFMIMDGIQSSCS